MSNPLCCSVLFTIIRLWSYSLWAASLLLGFILQLYFPTKLLTLWLLWSIMLVDTNFLINNLFKLVWFYIFFHNVSCNQVRLVCSKRIFALWRKFVGWLFWYKDDIIVNHLAMVFCNASVSGLYTWFWFRFVRTYWLSPFTIFLWPLYSLNAYLMPIFIGTVAKTISLAVKLAHNNIVPSPTCTLSQPILLSCQVFSTHYRLRLFPRAIACSHYVLVFKVRGSSIGVHRGVNTFNCKFAHFFCIPACATSAVYAGVEVSVAWIFF